MPEGSQPLSDTPEYLPFRSIRRTWDGQVVLANTVDWHNKIELKALSLNHLISEFPMLHAKKPRKTRPTTKSY